MKKNVLIGYNFILHYRVPLFNRLSERYNVTVLHSGKKMAGNQDSYNEIITNVYKLGPFFFQPGFLKEVFNPKYDVVISLFDVAWITTLLSTIFHPKKKKFILWGAWITGNNVANYVRVFFSKKVDANIFYTYQSLEDFVNRNVSKEKVFVANNTFDVGDMVPSYKNVLKNQIIFVGSLDERKQNDVLLKAFKNITPRIPQDIVLTMIGEGSQLNQLKKIAEDLELNDRVAFLGKINNNDLLREQYKSAIASVSYGQAGLSVLQSLGYGVPFITKKNAISGGEITNIINEYNGFLCEDNIKSLENSLLRICMDIPFARKLGKNAYYYYKNYCTMENMAQGFIDAIENTRLSKTCSNKPL